MKLYKYLFLLSGVALIYSCEDDGVRVEQGDPLNRNVIPVGVSVSSANINTAEDVIFPFNVTLDQTFSTDVTVTAKVTLDNGNVATGTAVVAAGTNSGSGEIDMPADDGFTPAALIDSQAGIVKAVALLLDELEPGNTYVADSNTLDINLFANALPASGGINVIADWAGAPDVDLDMQIIDRAFTAIFENAGSVTRFEEDLFQNTGRPDGIYDIYLRPYSDPATPEGTPYIILLTLPDGNLVDIQGVLDPTAPIASRVPVATFEKVTDEVTGIVSYINVTAL